MLFPSPAWERSCSSPLSWKDYALGVIFFFLKDVFYPLWLTSPYGNISNMCFWSWLINTFLKNSSWDWYAFEFSDLFNGLTVCFIHCFHLFFLIQVFHCVQRCLNLFMESRTFSYSWITQILLNNKILLTTYVSAPSFLFQKHRHHPLRFWNLCFFTIVDDWTKATEFETSLILFLWQMNHLSGSPVQCDG